MLDTTTTKEIIDTMPGAPEIFTEAMLEAGVLALAHIRQSLCDDEITLREAVRLVYLAARQAKSSPMPVLETGYRKLFPASVFWEMSRLRSDLAHLT